jgi:hypothetical protein
MFEYDVVCHAAPHCVCPCSCCNLRDRPSISVLSSLWLSVVCPCGIMSSHILMLIVSTLSAVTPTPGRGYCSHSLLRRPRHLRVHGPRLQTVPEQLHLGGCLLRQRRPDFAGKNCHILPSTFLLSLLSRCSLFCFILPYIFRVLMTLPVERIAALLFTQL